MDLLDELAAQARATVESGYYEGAEPQLAQPPSLAKAIASKPRAVLAELKPASPTSGPLRPFDLGTARRLGEAGARGLSVLTEPHTFQGSLVNLRAASQLGVPAMMKDIVVADRQLAAARRCGSRAVLLIATLHARGLAELGLRAMVDAAHHHGLEAMVEVANIEEFRAAQGTGCELIGINNRDLRTMKVDLNRTADILGRARKDRLVVGLSGVHTRQDADRLFESGCDAVLVGTNLMKAADPASALGALL
ncbi:MAG: indole-3-glycerol-phosphate synthase [Halobacteriales archaeon]|nr:indole-3-glycerol-phosphate synthase [Halobacteriales archaeon]